MKYLLLFVFLTLPVFAQTTTEDPASVTDDNRSKKDQKVPQSSAEEEKQEEQADSVGPYDREGNYKIKTKAPDSDIPTD
jgi:hypothetical protein